MNDIIFHIYKYMLLFLSITVRSFLFLYWLVLYNWSLPIYVLIIFDDGMLSYCCLYSHGIYVHMYASCLNGFTLVILGPFLLFARCEPRLRIKGLTLTYNGLLLTIVIWMESCLISTNTTSSYIYEGIWERRSSG